MSRSSYRHEDPVFIQPVEHVLVSEDAPLYTVVHVIQAYDPDGDDVTFAFPGFSVTLLYKSLFIFQTFFREKTLDTCQQLRRIMLR